MAWLKAIVAVGLAPLVVINAVAVARLWVALASRRTGSWSRATISLASANRAAQVGVPICLFVGYVVERQATGWTLLMAIAAASAVAVGLLGGRPAFASLPPAAQAAAKSSQVLLYIAAIPILWPFGTLAVLLIAFALLSLATAGVLRGQRETEGIDGLLAGRVEAGRQVLPADHAAGAEPAQRSWVPDHVRRNRAGWDVYAESFAAPGRSSWAAPEPHWGVFHLPESEVHLLPERLAGMHTLELGCGTAYVSAWLARGGARPVGVDVSTAQLATARALQREFGLTFPLIQADAERVPLRTERFDLVISEYGASIWCDPLRWIPEAARLLRPGGELIFLVNGTILMLCMPDSDAGGAATDRLLRDYFGMHRFEWPDDTTVDFHLGYGDWIRLLRHNGLEVEDLVELRPPEAATTRFPFVTSEWARRWPAEEVWKARKRG